MVEKHFYKSIQDGCVNHVGYGYGTPVITEEEYNELRELLLSAPEAQQGWTYQLTETLEWKMIRQEVVANGNAEV